MDKLLQRQRNRRFESQNPERSAVKLHILECRLVRRMVGGDHVHRAVSKSCDQRLPIFARSQRRIHFEARIILYVLVDQREVMRRHFARHL